MRNEMPMETRTLLAAVAAVLVALATAGAMSAVAADPGYTATVELPDDLRVGENELRVAVTNTGEDVLFSPIVEVPLGSGLAAPADPNPWVLLGDRSSENRTHSVENASYRDGDSLYVYGEEVDPGETRTYVFTLNVTAPGDRTVEAEVRPLYNESLAVRNSATGTALAPATLNVSVVDANGATLPGATVSINETDRTGGDRSLSVLEGTYEVSAADGGVSTPALDVTLGPYESTDLRFVALNAPTDPTVLATSGNGSVADASVTRSVTRGGNATQATTFELSFTTETEGGTTVVGVGPPSELPAAYDSVTATVDGVDAPVTMDGTTALVTLTGSGASDVVLTYEGYPTGDASGDGTVDASDARVVAGAVAGSGSALPYGDANGDGELTAVDAMLIAQYTENNRDDYFRGA